MAHSPTTGFPMADGVPHHKTATDRDLYPHPHLDADRHTDRHADPPARGQYDVAGVSFGTGPPVYHR